MRSVWSWGRPPKFACTDTLHFCTIIQHFLTNVGRIRFWIGKWTPNGKYKDVLESRLNKISNELSQAQFQHWEGLQIPSAKRRCTLGIEHYALGTQHCLCSIQHLVQALCLFPTRITHGKALRSWSVGSPHPTGTQKTSKTLHDLCQGSFKLSQG